MILIKTILAVFLIGAFSQLAFAQTDDALKNVFREYIELENAGSSLVMVEVSESGHRFVAHGRLSHLGSSAKSDEKTIYEIGSITKVFTGILLAEAVRRGEVKLNDPISNFLPHTVRTPKYNGKEITLIDLTTHTSALPRLPDNLSLKNQLDPYSDYFVQNAYDFLSSYKLTREIGAKYDYSNYAVGLLGHILSRRAKMSYERLVTTRLLIPLRMTDTSLSLPKMKIARHAQGFDEDNHPVPNWHFDVLAGAGAIRTTATDMAKFISANLGFTKTPLYVSMLDAQKMLRQGDNEYEKVGMGWIGIDFIGTRAVVHGGTTGGFSSYVLLATEKKKGVFIAWNWGGANGVEFLQSIAFNAISNKFPIKRASAPKKEITLSEEVLEQYVGEYQMAPNFSITVTRDGKHLFTQGTGQAKFEIFAEKEDEFFAKTTRISLSFKRDASRKVAGMIIHQSGMDTPADKIR